MGAKSASTGIAALARLTFPRLGCLASLRSAPTTHKQTDGNHDQQQAVPAVRQTHDQSGHVHEVLSLQ